MMQCDWCPIMIDTDSPLVQRHPLDGWFGLIFGGKHQLESVMQVNVPPPRVLCAHGVHKFMPVHKSTQRDTL